MIISRRNTHVHSHGRIVLAARVWVDDDDVGMGLACRRRQQFGERLLEELRACPRAAAERAEVPGTFETTEDAPLERTRRV